jgi:hypothetical protein
VWALWGKATRYDGYDSLGGSATTIATGTVAQDMIGQTVAATADVDGDGASELWIEKGYTGELGFFYGGSDLRTTSLDIAADAAASFALKGDEVSGATVAGDWTGDGVSDVWFAFGGEGNGYVALFESKAWTGRLLVPDFLESVEISGDSSNDSFGLGVPGRCVDLDGDGKPDMAVGDWEYDTETGSVALFYQ